MAKIKLDAHNARKHSDRNKSAIRKSLEHAKAARSIVLDADDNVLAGNGVYEQAAELGIPVQVVETRGEVLIAVKRVDIAPDSPEARQIATLDNLTADTSAFDYDADRLRAALENDPIAKKIANEDARLRELLKTEPQPETADIGELIDRAAELQKKWQCAQGDIWTAAGHFWICGDCRDAETWTRLLQSAEIEKVNGVFTSPPYAEQRKKQYGGTPTDKYVEWWEAVQANVRANLAADGSFFVNIKPHCEKGERVLYVFDLVLAMRRKWGWKYVDELCWVDTKNGVPGFFPNRFKDAFEPVYQFTAGAHKFCPDNASFESEDAFIGNGGSPLKANGRMMKHQARFVGNVLPSNVLQIATQGKGDHEASFPVALPTFFVKAYSDAGDMWCDPFAGSGTTAVACHRENRKALLIEALPKYVSVICERLAQLGLEPRRVASAQAG